MHLCRDLKAANLLVSDEGRILVADFGACATLEREARIPSLHSALRRAMQEPASSSGALFLHHHSALVHAVPSLHSSKQTRQRCTCCGG